MFHHSRILCDAVLEKTNVTRQGKQCEASPEKWDNSLPLVEEVWGQDNRHNDVSGQDGGLSSEQRSTAGIGGICAIHIWCLGV